MKATTFAMTTQVEPSSTSTTCENPFLLVAKRVVRAVELLGIFSLVVCMGGIFFLNNFRR
jgi:hypothetical protein